MTYSITRDRATNWDENFVYKYRRKSSSGYPVAEDEMSRRRDAGEPAVLWGWENFEPRMLECVNI